MIGLLGGGACLLGLFAVFGRKGDEDLDHFLWDCCAGCVELFSIGV